MTREREKRRNYLYKEGQGGQAGGEREEKVECYGCVTQVAVLAATECHTLSSRERERKRDEREVSSLGYQFTFPKET